MAHDGRFTVHFVDNDDLVTMTVTCERCGNSVEGVSIGHWRMTNLGPWMLDHLFNRCGKPVVGMPTFQVPDDPLPRQRGPDR